MALNLLFKHMPYYLYWHQFHDYITLNNLDKILKLRLKTCNILYKPTWNSVFFLLVANKTLNTQVDGDDFWKQRDRWTWWVYSFLMQDVTFFCRRKGGSSSRNLPHSKWCQSVQLEPDVILMSFIPISSLLSGIDGSGFLSHAINLYLRCKLWLQPYYAYSVEHYFLIILVVTKLLWSILVVLSRIDIHCQVADSVIY